MRRTSIMRQRIFSKPCENHFSAGFGWEKLVKMVFCLILPVVLLVSAACSGGGGAGSLAVSGFSTSVSLVSGDTQTLSYAATLTNTSPNSLFIEFVGPVPSAGLEPKVLSDNLARAISKNVVSGQTVDVKGSFPFDAKDMTKEQIDALAPFITGFHVIYEETVPVKK